MIGLDTNILVRFVAQDDAVNSPLANRVMSSLSAEQPGWISTTAVVEFVWVMTRKFRIERVDIYAMLDQFLRSPDVVVEQADMVQRAANLYRKGSADFSDYLIACSGQAAGCEHTVTFDRRAAKSAGMKLTL